MSMDRDIQFLYEIGSLRFLDRQWRRFLNTGIANLAEHHFRVIWIALILAEREGIEDTEKVIKMALVHDIAESRTGDVDYIARQYVKRNEKLGINDMLQHTALNSEFITLWREYEKKDTDVAKVVKDADTLDVDLELQEQKVRGVNLAETWREQRQFVKNTLYTRSAKKMWEQIQTSDPHEWHIQGRNRLNSGDWKTKT